MKHLLLLSLFLSIGAQAQSDDEVRWAPTNLRPLFLDNTITEAFCGRESIRFKGCAAAVEVFARFQNSSYDLIVKNEKFQLTKSDQYLLKESNFREYQRTQRLKLNEIEKNFSPATMKSLIELYAELRSKNPNPKPHEIALPLNESQAVIYDPHKQYIPLFRYNGLNHIRLKPAIGIAVDRKDDRVVISDVTVNGSGELAGLKVDDELLKINGKAAKDAEFNFENGEVVTLVARRADRIFEVKVTFTYNKPGSVIDRAIDLDGKQYSYLHMSEVPYDFDPATTCNVFKKFLSEFDTKFEGMVLDLRNNVGGPGDTAACLTSLFVGGEKHIYSETDFSDLHTEPVLGGFDQVFNKKLVVLVNASTASSGEIMASALQFHGRALILGERTFGKAIGQIQEDYVPDRVALLFTALKAYRPDGLSYHGKGVTPDALVYRHGMKPSERELQTLREEDLALYPLVIENGKFYEAQAKRLQFPEACVSEAKVQENLENLKDTDWQKDFQLQYALETLKCLN